MSQTLFFIKLQSVIIERQISFKPMAVFNIFLWQNSTIKYLFWFEFYVENEITEFNAVTTVLKTKWTFFKIDSVLITIKFWFLIPRSFFFWDYKPSSLESDLAKLIIRSFLKQILWSFILLIDIMSTPHMHE